MKNTLKTTVVGSYPVPEDLKARPNEQTLLDAMTVLLRAQERAGVDVISDGELGRWDLERNQPGGMVERFVRFMSGVEAEPTEAQLEAYRKRADTAYRKGVPGIVTGELGAGKLDLQRDWERARPLSDRPQKFTITSPYMIAKLVIDEHYGDLERLAMAVAAVLAEQVSGIDAAVLQVDEPNLPGTPDDASLAAKAINLIPDAAASDEKAVHLCFGNYGGQTIQTGDYRKLIAFLNALHADHLVLETTRRPPEEIEALRDIRPEIGLGVGVIDVKEPRVETPEIVARTIEQIAGIVGPEKLCYVHPDCGLQNLTPAAADAKLQALVRGRDLYLGSR